jgi:cytochrome c oxidase cbb3-type subunit 2
MTMTAEPTLRTGRRGWSAPGLRAALAPFGALLLASLGCAPPAARPPEPANPAQAAKLEYAQWETAAPGEMEGYNQRANLVQRGRVVYSKYCAGCHGQYGDGNGPAAARLITKPRDFTSGIFKFRSTDSGSLPMESDLHRTITRGLARVSMPAFPLMPETDKLAVIEYVKGFYPRWDEEKARRRVVPVPRAPQDLGDAQRQQRGRIAYLELGCWQCHGVDGRGSKATQTEYTDAWGHQQKPFDFTSGGLKGGNSPEDIYRTFHTGLRSIMPAYDFSTMAMVNADSFGRLDAVLEPAELDALRPLLSDFPASTLAIQSEVSDAERAQLSERNSWDLVAYILSLRTETTTADAVLGPRQTGP